MANEEHLSILKQEVEVWNRWRQEYSDIYLNLKSADLHGSDLREANLYGANLVGADLSNALQLHL